MPPLNNGIGVLGGSFDPIHLGHTQSAQSVAKELNLAQVILIPAYISPLKGAANVVPHASAKQRAEMVTLACKQTPIFTPDFQELERAGHSYTIDTLKALKHQYPQLTLHVIIGMDSLLTFTQWHQYLDILSLCHLVVNTRPNHSINDVNTDTKALLSQRQVHDKKQLLLHKSGKIYFAKPAFYDVSSTEIRQSLANELPCDVQLLPEISDYIHKNKLYR